MGFVYFLLHGTMLTKTPPTCTCTCVCAQYAHAVQYVTCYELQSAFTIHHNTHVHVDLHVC